MKRLSLRENLFIITLQESFVATVPYLLISAFFILLTQMAGHRQWVSPNILHILNTIATFSDQFIAVIVLVSLAYHFSLRYGMEPIIAILISLILLTTIVPLYEMTRPEGMNENLLPDPGFNLFSITVPIVVVLILRRIPCRSRSPESATGHLFIDRIFNCFYPSIIVYFLGTILYCIFLIILRFTFPVLRSLPAPAFSTQELMTLRILLSQMLWFFGLHGPHFVNALFGTDFLRHTIFPNLTYGSFYRFFAVSGGSGMGLSLFLALLLQRNHPRARKLIRFSAPFIPFNINTIILFGLPVVFNRHLLLPFLFLPLLSLGVAYVALLMHPVTFQPVVIPWITPPFVNTYLATGGDSFVLLLQLFLVLLGTLIYYPFVRRYLNSQSAHNHKQELEKKLGITTDLQLNLRAKEGLSAFEAHRLIIEANYRVEQFIASLPKNPLAVYYQPIVDMRAMESRAFEALLRMRKGDAVVPPYFLGDLEQAGLASIIDLWVCQQVARHMEQWAEAGFYPRIHVNLHPDTITSEEALRRVAETLADKRVEFEVVERALLVRERAHAAIATLRDGGFLIALDDFGTGYSNLEVLTIFEFDHLKLDRALINTLKRPRARVLCEHIVALGHELETCIIAEGVEDDEQLHHVQRLGVDEVQGFYFAHALAADAVPVFHP